MYRRDSSAVRDHVGALELVLLLCFIKTTHALLACEALSSQQHDATKYCGCLMNAALTKSDGLVLTKLLKH